MAYYRYMDKGGPTNNLTLSTGDLYNILFSVRDRRDSLESGLKKINCRDADWDLVNDLSALEAKVELIIANGGIN